MFKPHQSALVLLLAVAISFAAPTQAQQKDVIVVGGALTEIVYALGAEARIAGTDTTSMFPEAAKSLPKIGYQRTLSAEGLLALKPKILLGTGEAGPPPVLAQLRAAGMQVEVLPTNYTIQSVVERVKKSAQVLGMSGQGDALIAKLNSEWDVATKQVAARTGKKPKVLFVMAHGGPTPQVAGEETSADAIIRLAGGENAMSGFKGYRPLTSEGVVTAAPDYILITSEGLTAQGGVDELLKKPGLNMTPAGQKKRVIFMDALKLMGFGPRLPQAVRELNDAFWTGR
jgi:iron complex transport system substrate-binding protein